MEVTKEQSRAYTEVLEVLKNIPKEDFEKIPEEKIKYFKANMDKEYDFKIDENKTFEEQILLDKTKLVLAILFRDYWATTEQKEKIIAKEKYDLNVIEEQKRERYDPEDIFKNEKNIESEDENKENSLVEVKEESFFYKIISFFKSIFKFN